MTSAFDRLEGQIADLLEKAKQFKTQAREIRRQGFTMAQENEVKVRQSLRKYFEDGLKFLDKTLEKGKKAQQKFTDVTERKAKVLKAQMAEASETKKPHTTHRAHSPAKAAKSAARTTHKRGRTKTRAHRSGSHSATTH